MAISRDSYTVHVACHSTIYVLDDIILNPHPWEMPYTQNNLPYLEYEFPDGAIDIQYEGHYIKTNYLTYGNVTEPTLKLIYPELVTQTDTGVLPSIGDLCLVYWQDGESYDPAWGIFTWWVLKEINNTADGNVEYVFKTNVNLDVDVYNDLQNSNFSNLYEYARTIEHLIIKYATGVNLNTHPYEDEYYTPELVSYYSDFSVFPNIPLSKGFLFQGITLRKALELYCELTCHNISDMTVSGWWYKLDGSDTIYLDTQLSCSMFGSYTRYPIPIDSGIINASDSFVSDYVIASYDAPYISRAMYGDTIVSYQYQPIFGHTYVPPTPNYTYEINTELLSDTELTSQQFDLLVKNNFDYLVPPLLGNDMVPDDLAPGYRYNNYYHPMSFYLFYFH